MQREMSSLVLNIKLRSAWQGLRHFNVTHWQSTFTISAMPSLARPVEHINPSIRHDAPYIYITRQYFELTMTPPCRNNSGAMLRLCSNVTVEKLLNMKEAQSKSWFLASKFTVSRNRCADIQAATDGTDARIKSRPIPPAVARHEIDSPGHFYQRLRC
jgi:hypothetical protein